MHQVTASSLREPQKTHTNQNFSWKGIAKTISLVVAPSLTTLIITKDPLPTTFAALASSVLYLSHLHDTSGHSFFKDLDSLQTIGSISPRIHANLIAQSINLTSSKFQNYVNSLAQSSVFRKPAISKLIATSILSSYALAQKNKQILPQIYAEERISTNRDSDFRTIAIFISLTTISINFAFLAWECLYSINNFPSLLAEYPYHGYT